MRNRIECVYSKRKGSKIIPLKRCLTILICNISKISKKYYDLFIECPYRLTIGLHVELI